MKKNDEKTKKRVCLGLLTHPHLTLNTHSTFNPQPSTLNIQHSTLIQHSKVQILFILFVVLNKISTFLFNTNEILNIFCIFAPV